jgi:bacterioferritin-associated ferredoxin
VIVCSCNVISDHQVRSVTAERTVRATSEVYRCLGCSAECGRCARTIRRILDEALGAVASACAEGDCLCASSKTGTPGNTVGIASLPSPSTDPATGLD